MKKYRKPHRFKKKRPVFKNQFFWPVILILIFIISLSYLLFFSQFLKVRNIIISGNRKISYESLMSVIEMEINMGRWLFPSDNIFFIDLKKIKQEIFNTFPYIATIEANKVFPDSLNFNITERRAEAVFCRDYNSNEEDENQLTYQKCFLLDKEGVIYEELQDDTARLPKIKNPNLEDELRLGKKVITPELLSKVLDIFSGTESFKILVKEILIVSEDRINLRTFDDWEIYFNPQEEIDWQLIKLEAVLENIPSEKRSDLEYIELRFGNLAPFKYREEE
jgi:cell division septal protein FtsQ